MTLDDLAQVLEIERGAYSFPWPIGIFRDCLRVGYCCRVVEQSGHIEAYGIMSVAAGEGHLLNLCVRKSSQRMGLGRGMLMHLMKLAALQGADVMFLEVRPSNLPALQLYESMGFNTTGVRRGYYPALHRREDALVLACQIAHPCIVCERRQAVDKL